MVPTPNKDTNGPRPGESSKRYYRAHATCEADEIVISGISGRFPNAKNVAIYNDKLLSKTNMIDPEETRWKLIHPDVPKASGHVADIDKFDATFFGVHPMQAKSMDPQCRCLIEESYKAVIDAGINPNSIRGKNVGVYVGSCFSETEKKIVSENAEYSSFAIIGCSRAMYANRISYSLGITGPSLLMDTACSSSMYCIDLAYNALRNGEIDAAIVGGTNLILHPNTTLHFARLGVLSPTGVCSPFDQNANGYVRSEGIAAIYLQRRGDARRIYATLVHSKTNCDGFKQHGITYPSGEMQEALLRGFYSEISVSPNDIGFMEAHSTGTVVGDPEECRAIDNVICKNRTDQLLIGSVKGNIGHSEPTSGLCSVVKVAQIFQTGKIPPNVNFKASRKEIEGLQSGRMKVVTEVATLKKPYVAVNSFGFGGANAHILLKQYEKKKTSVGYPDGSLPSLVLWSGRTDETVKKLFDKLESAPLDPDFVALLRSIQDGGVPGMVFRGYNVLNGTGSRLPVSYGKDVQHFIGVNRPVVWVYSGMGSQWTGMGLVLMAIPQFRQAIQRCHNTLKPAGVDLINILTSDNPKTFDNIMHSFVGIAAIQIALTDVLRTLGMQPDYIIGHSTGELGCAYADGCFTAEQMILAAYYRGKVSLEKEKIKGSMAAIGLSYKDIKSLVPEAIEVACHNGPDSCTISGPAEDVAKFVSELKSQGVFAREVPCSNIAYHTRYIAHLGEDFLKYLKHIVPTPKKRSTKWLSTSVPQELWSRPESTLSSAEYHTNNLLSSVLFEETAALLPKDSLTIEVAPHCLLQSILKSAIPNGSHVGLTQRNNKDNHMFLLAGLGKLFVNGLDIPVQALYPKVEYPVSRGTDTISDLIELDHQASWNNFAYNKSTDKKTGEKAFFIDLRADMTSYMAGHNIDGKVLVPATFYLECVWKTFAMTQEMFSFTDCCVEMENVKFMRATTLTADRNVQLTVMIHFGSGNFELVDNDSLVVSGTIREIRDAKQPAPVKVKPFNTKYGQEFTLSSRDFYKELKLRGYYYSGRFKAVESVRGDGHIAHIKWDSNWVTFMDCMLQTQILKKDSRDLCLPTKIGKIRIFSSYLDTKEDKAPVEVYTSDLDNRIVGGGIEISGLEISVVQRRKPPGLPVLERYQFVPNLLPMQLSAADVGRFCVQFALENYASSKMTVVEILSGQNQSPLIEHFQNAIEDLPLITGNYTILSSGTYKDLPEDVTVVAGDIAGRTDLNFIIDQTGTDVLSLINSLTDNGFLVLVVKSNSSVSIPKDMTVLASTIIAESGSKIMLLRKTIPLAINDVQYLKINSSDTEFQWLKTAQSILTSNDLVLVSENDKLNGLLGLVNCLTKEYSKTLARCVIIDDPKAPPFDPKKPLYANQLALGMTVNVYRQGQWGTYRHLRLAPEYPLAPCADHVYANILHRGDMSTLKWLQGRLNAKKSEIRVVYSSLNFKDIMLATGRISADTAGEGRINQECVLGLEYSGINVKTGKKVMGMMLKAAVSSHIEAPSELTMDVPDKWTLRDAATVPVVYFTVYYAFFIRTDIRKGKRILIHAGTGGIGMSAIRTALAYGLEVFTTVSTPEKKAFLLKTFPQLKASHIGNSRDTSFETMVRDETNGEGVDFVLNSLAEEKLIASVKCLGKRGVFLEIGKFDMANDNPLGLGPFLKELTFCAVLLDLLLSCNDPSVVKNICDIVAKDIERGIIQPLPSTVFPAKDMEQAFRFLASGKHMGKVLVQVRESAEAMKTLPMQVLPIVYFSPELVYVVPGGLGGFGLELVDWMILRGARKVVLSSSRGISNGYQSYRIQLWKTYGCEIGISTANISTKQGCEKLLREAMTLGPVGGIFNLAVVLKDAFFENQTVELFQQSLAPKAFATKHLDDLSRQLCPKLHHFVIFSSVSCGRGNAGQTNYGMANSIMERIIEDRVANGLPGKAIEWGAVGDVGLVAVMAEDKVDLEIGGTLQQRISSCLHELDTLLTCPDPLVASMVVAEKRLGQAGSENVLETVMNILAIRDTKSISYSTSLSELGMDSLMAVDIKQTLERDFEIFLSPQDLRSLTLQKLQEYSQDNKKVSGDSNKKDKSETRQKITAMLQNLGDEANADKILVPLNQGKKNKHVVFFIPGIEGTSGKAWEDLGKHIAAPSYLIQLNKTAQMASLDEIAEFVVKQITSLLKPGDNFRVVAYSFGTVIAMKAIHLLEKLGHKGKVFLIDGSPLLLQALYKSYSDAVGIENVNAIILSNIVSLLLADETEENCLHVLMKVPSMDGRLILFQKYIARQKVFSQEYVYSQSQAVLQRSLLVNEMDITSFKPITTPIGLVKPTSPIVSNFVRDYGLSRYTEEEISISELEGDHASILNNPQLPILINEFLFENRT